MPKEFEISRLLELSSEQKYATTVAAFKVIDHLEQIEIPKKLQLRKPAVQSMYALSDSLVKWDFISEEQRRALEEELRAARKSRSALDAVFSTPGSVAPIADESEEELEEIIEMEPTEQYVEEYDDEEGDQDGDESAADEEEESDEEEVDQEDDFDDDDDDDDSDSDSDDDDIEEDDDEDDE